MGNKEEDFGPGLTPWAVALLSGDPERDRATESQIARAGLRVRAFLSPDSALAAAGKMETVLLVLDAENPELNTESFLNSYSEAHDERPPPVVALLGEAQSPSDILGTRAAAGHFLSRPFGGATLTALCRALSGSEARGADSGPRPEEAVTPPLRIRHPARFSVRPLYGEMVSYVRERLDAIRSGEPPDLRALGMFAERAHTSLLQSNLLLLRALEPYARFDLAQHCVNVAVIAGKVAMALGSSLAETQRTIQSGLLHDLGMVRVPEPILHKEGPLSELERHEMQLHPIHGSELLSALGSEWDWMAGTVRQEHERWKGQGYPQGLVGNAIDEMAQILGIADVFEAYSQIRRYRSPFTLYEALEKVTAMRDEYFSAKLVDTLASEISVFPVDSYVQLSTGEIGRVVAANSGNLMRPTLDVLWDADWKPLAKGHRIALSEHAEIAIVRPLHEAGVPIT